MKNVIKISISGLAFTLEEDGYILLDRYLTQLRKYYARQQNGMEVVEGIEERIADLLRERMGTPEEVVSKELIQAVMAIMGKPEDIEEENTGEPARESDKSAAFEPRPRRKLYRNPDNRILGGVCSGLGAYFNMEPLFFRLLFVVLALFSSFGLGFLRFFLFPFVGISLGGWVFITYIVLWIAIPAARTVAQKCEMRGERPDFSGVQDRVKRGAEHLERGVRSTGAKVADGAGRIIAICAGVILLLIAIPVLIVVPVSVIISASWLHGALPQGICSLVALGGSMFWIKLLAALVSLLPFVGMLYAGIYLVFRLRPQRIRPGLIIFICWLVSLIALVTVLVMATRPYYGGAEEVREELVVHTQSDTLYISYVTPSTLPDKHLFMEADASEAFLGWFDGNKKNLQAVVYPRIRIIRVDSLQDIKIGLSGIAAGRTMNDAYRNAKESLPDYNLQDSLLSLQPEVYTHQNQWQGNMNEVLVYLPLGKQVVMTSPRSHHFDRNAPRISMGQWRKSRSFHMGPRINHWHKRIERKTERWGKDWERKWDRWEEQWD